MISDLRKINIVPFKIYPLHHEVSFYPSFLSVSVKRCDKVIKEGVD